MTARPTASARPPSSRSPSPATPTSPTSARPDRCARTSGAASGATSWRWSASCSSSCSSSWPSSPRSSRPTTIDERDSGTSATAPSTEHCFGTDQIGRDVFSRVVYGARVSLQIGIIATGISLIIGLAARCHRRLLRRLARHADHADHRHLPGDPLHRPRRRHRLGARPQREHGDPRARASPAGWASAASCAASFLSLQQLEYVEAAAALGYVRAADHVPPHPAQRAAADHRVRHHRRRRGDPGRGRPVVPRRRPAVPDAGLGPDGVRSRRVACRRPRTCSSSRAWPSSSPCSPSCSSATASATPWTRS